MNLTNNQQAIYDELSGGYELDDLRTLANTLGLADSDMLAPGKKRLSKPAAGFVHCNQS